MSKKIVWLAWYHDGFTDDPPELIGLYATEKLADGGMESHKATGDRTIEYKDRAKWWKEEKQIVWQQPAFGYVDTSNPPCQSPSGSLTFPDHPIVPDRDQPFAESVLPPSAPAHPPDAP